MSARKQIKQAITSTRPVAGGQEIELTYRLGDDPPVPAILLLPSRSTALPAAILLHGYSSRKEVMAHSIGRALFEQGIATLSIDLPMHGTRADPVQLQASRNPLGMMQQWRIGIAEVRTAIRYLAARSEIDHDRIAIAGYSMGAFIAVTVAADEPMIKAVLLAAGGDLPDGSPFAAVARMAVDPTRAVKKLAGRPLLMVHGKNDRTVTPQQAQRLFDAANEPKQLIWYDAGHYLPHAASAAGARWLSEKLGARSGI